MLNALVLEHTVVALAGAFFRTVTIGGTHLYSLCINAVWTTFGCCAAAAAPIAGVEAPFVALPASESPFVCGVVPFLSPTGLLKTGGPMVGNGEGVMSIGSRGGVSVDEVDDGRIGMDLCSPWL